MCDGDEQARMRRIVDNVPFPAVVSHSSAHGLMELTNGDTICWERLFHSINNSNMI